MTTDIVPTNDWEAILPTIRHMFAKGATDAEFKILCMTARKLGLDPSLKQIWCVKNLNKPDQPAQIYASRDGLVAIAHRSGQFDGMESGVRTNEAGEVVGAYCRIWRKDMGHPFEVEILRGEYDTLKNLWLSKPATMSVKVAEAHCLRRAFDICGVYTPDEMPDQEGARVIPDTSRPASTIVDMSKSTNPCQIDTAGPGYLRPLCRGGEDPAPAGGEPADKCDHCGRSLDKYPALRIEERDGRRICGGCMRSAEKVTCTSPLPAEPAPSAVAPKAVQKPVAETVATAKVPAPAPTGAVCEECGKTLEAPEEKSSRLFMSRALCRACLQHATGPQDGERA